MSTILDLAGRHAGETCTIVGRGPSLVRLTAGAVPPGPVIAINLAILTIRQLGLPNPVYAMQKDGCVTHDIIGHWTGNTRSCPGPCREVLSDNPTVDPEMIPPVGRETLLVAAAESPYCFPAHPQRHVFDVERDFGLAWWTMSTPTAVLIAHLMGCTSLVMIGHDAYTAGDDQLYEPGQGLLQFPNGYRQAGAEADRVARQLGMQVTWIKPDGLPPLASAGAEEDR